jgi:predicted secreted protein
MRSLPIVGLIFSALLLDVVSLTASPSSLPIDQTITEKDNGRELRVAVGDTVTVKLGAQLGTGYGWHVTSGPGSRLQQTDKRPKIESNSNSPGSSELEVFRFTARRPGRVRLELRYSRPREKSAGALKTFHVFIVIR